MIESPKPRLTEIAAEWREARRLYPIYAAVISRFELPLKSCKYLDSPVDSADDESTAAVREWLRSADEVVDALQLRQIHILVFLVHLFCPQSERCRIKALNCLNILYIFIV